MDDLYQVCRYHLELNWTLEWLPPSHSSVFKEDLVKIRLFSFQVGSNSSQHLPHAPTTTCRVSPVQAHTNLPRVKGAEPVSLGAGTTVALGNASVSVQLVAVWVVLMSCWSWVWARYWVGENLTINTCNFDKWKKNIFKGQSTCRWNMFRFLWKKEEKKQEWNKERQKEEEKNKTNNVQTSQHSFSIDLV